MSKGTSHDRPVHGGWCPCIMNGAKYASAGGAEWRRWRAMALHQPIGCPRVMHFTLAPPPKKVSPPQFLHYCVRPAPAGPLKRLEYRTCRRRRPTDSNKLHFLGASSSFKTIRVFRKLSPRMVFAGFKLQSCPDIFGTLRHLICTRRCVQTSNMKRICHLYLYYVRLT